MAWKIQGDLDVTGGLTVGTSESGGTTTIAGSLTIGAYLVRSADAAVTADVDTPPTLAKDVNVITAATGTGTSIVRLPVAVPGIELTIINASGETVDIDPQDDAKINGGTAGVAFSCAASTTMSFTAISATEWYRSDVAAFTDET